MRYSRVKDFLGGWHINVSLHDMDRRTAMTDTYRGLSCDSSNRVYDVVGQ